jgi:2-polyprenyl-3-methyl-5-hydroxy-6-metoxy-1,4-benzoquinol methylase
MFVPAEKNFMRRVAGYHDLRLDGMSDLITRARGASVLDIGCNRGLVAFEMANNGAKIAHGCDNYEDGIKTAREIFADLRNCEGRFEVVDLTRQNALQVFGDQKYDIVLMLATYHKLKRVMDDGALGALMRDLARRTISWLGWRGTSEKTHENEDEIKVLDKLLRDEGLRRIHTSYLSQTLGVAAIWGRK